MPKKILTHADETSEEDFFVWLGEVLGVTPEEARGIFKEELGRFGPNGEMIQ